MAFEALSEKPLRVEKMSVLDGIVWAFAPEYEHLMLALGGFEWINNIDKCNGVLLNRIGQLVCLTRQQAGAMIGSRELADNDDIYRVCLKYKAYVNSCRCTPNEIIEATKIMQQETLQAEICRSNVVALAREPLLMRVALLEPCGTQAAPLRERSILQMVRRTTSALREMRILGR